MAIGVNDVEQLDDVGILHFLEKGDLPDRRAGNTLIFGLQSDLFKGDNSIRMIEFAGLVDNTVGSCGPKTREIGANGVLYLFIACKHVPSPIFSIF